MAEFSLTQELVKSFFNYKDGILYWKEKTGRTKENGKAGYIHNIRGELRRCIGFKGKTFLASRLIFLYHNGYLPKEVDHRDNNPMNDNIDNLRAANRCQNTQNSTSCKNSTSKYLGVYLLVTNKKYTAKNGEEKSYHHQYWVASIRVDNKSKYLGKFETESNAAIAYNEAAQKHFGEFANLNIIN